MGVGQQNVRLNNIITASAIFGGYPGQHPDYPAILERPGALKHGQSVSYQGIDKTKAVDILEDTVIFGYHAQNLARILADVGVLAG